MADPVAAKSSFLCMYMSNHPDTLVSYVRHWGKVKQKVTSAQMTAIDTKGMSLTYTTSSGKQDIRVPFDPPLAGYEEVKPRLLGMKVDAEEALGMTKAPQITTYRWDDSFYKIAYAFGPLALLTILPGPTSLLGPAAPTYVLVEYVRENVIGPKAIAYLWGISFGIHALEGLYTLHLCRKHKTPLGASLLYFFSTVVCGFTVWAHFRKRVQEARIDSILKGQ
ncbi:hypothetical protein BC629DRAFT_1283121 [Irpex lacteus]|nr:hypothetical protein BC629DRAFT_1283121 [Irpex lacteus]